MSITPISAAGLWSVAPTTAATDVASSATDGTAFAQSLGTAVDGLQGMQSTSADLAVKAVTGELDNVHDYTIAATEAAVALELTAAVRNRAVDAFSEIMRMQA
ncbi:MAG: flagellar hook-basal body complex protein FliE [Demequina sp.]|uniref:flagellar hook-basal body complex protein FliE n=1 Tax=Demequina sp. TaxID=2050685 RepID=UPI003A870D54